MKTFLFTSESVGSGHPDKLCDQISDAILDAYLTVDPFAKVAIETVLKSNTAILVGEIKSNAKINHENIVKNVIKEEGYDFDDVFDYKTVNVLTYINEQSADISQAVQNEGAGDQGIMFGYATDETEEKMPMTIIFAHKIVKKLKELRKSVKWIRPDCKSQVTIEYANDNGALIPLRVDNIVVSCQHTEEIKVDDLRKFIIENVVEKVVPEHLLINTKYYIQPSGKFVLGGPSADAGLTGRKIIVDTYGGFGTHGGGCFSGKDCSKVDRSGAYAARWIAKSLVTNGICRRVLVQVSYAIGLNYPLAIHIDTYGTGNFSDTEILEIVKENFDLRVGSMIENLKLREPNFRKTSSFGHFGRKEFAWEQEKDLRLEDSPIGEK